MTELLIELKAVRAELEAMRAEQAEILKTNGELKHVFHQLSLEVKRLSDPLVSVE